MLTRYVVADLVRNPRRTLSTMVGVMLGVGLFCGVLFFVDGLSASMTQRAVAPLPLDMQRIVREQVGGALTLTQSFGPQSSLEPGDEAVIELEIANASDVAAHEVTVRSVPGGSLAYVAGSADLDGARIGDADQNPFAQGAAKSGLNLGTIEPGATHRISYRVIATVGIALDDSVVTTSYSSRESITPVRANEQAVVALDELSAMIAAIDGVADARQLSFADLGSGTLSADGIVADGPAKIFGFDAAYDEQDESVEIVAGELRAEGAVLSVEAARALGIGIGDLVTVTLPDGSTVDLDVRGLADLSRARSLFTSRRGGDLETFIYTPHSVVVSPQVFSDVVIPAYERAAGTRGERLKNPPVREIDVTLDRDRLAADPARALVETQRIGRDVAGIATRDDFVLDNISNTLAVAAGDASVAKRLFVFLGLPGGLLAALLAAYSGNVLADAQRREQATLRIRGASRRHLLRMLATRTALLTATGSAVGLAVGYAAASVILGQGSLDRASASSLVRSALIGSVVGFAATGLALYLTGRRSIDSQIDDDRVRLRTRPPLWRRAWLDVAATAVVLLGTAIAFRRHAFDGAAGSVYFGRAVRLNVALLILPIGVWVSGSLLAARLFGFMLARRAPSSSSDIGRPLPSLLRFSATRRPWAIGNGAIVVSMIVALTTTLGAFTASYDASKARDARFANGSDIRITPSPTAPEPFRIADAASFETVGIGQVTPVIYAVSNVIIRSDRTSDPANLAAIDPATFGSVAPLRDEHVASGDVEAEIDLLRDDPAALLLSDEMASFLKVKVGDRIFVLLARATDEQIEIEMRVAGLYERLPGFPEGADALIDIDVHATSVPSKHPDFFLATTASTDDAALDIAIASLTAGPGASGHLQIESRASTLARDQSSLAALNIAGLVDMDSTFALAMVVVTIAIFVFGLLLQRRREYITLRAQGLEPRTIRWLIAAEAAAVAIGGAVAGVGVGALMGVFFVAVLRPLFVLTPIYSLPLATALLPVGLVVIATTATSIAGSRLVNRLEPTELLRDE